MKFQCQKSMAGEFTMIRCSVYMQLVQGQALIDQWDSLGISDKLAVCDQLRGIVTSLRSVEQDPDDTFIGMLWNA
jgi:hypothetical protein